jgi:hypothetical protein
VFVEKEICGHLHGFPFKVCIQIEPRRRVDLQALNKARMVGESCLRCINVYLQLKRTLTLLESHINYSNQTAMADETHGIIHHQIQGLRDNRVNLLPGNLAGIETDIVVVILVNSGV